MKTPLVVAVTGHRPSKLGGYGAAGQEMRGKIRKWLSEKANALAEAHVLSGVSGMALGVDQWWSETCIELGIPWTAAVPFPGQESVWPGPSQKAYQNLIAKATTVRVLTQTKPQTKGDAARLLQDRNVWMVDNCGLLLCVWDGTSGGTGNCIQYASTVSRRMIRCNPKSL